MTIAFACECGKRLTAKNNMRGAHVRCPACERELVIPPPSASEVPAAAPRSVPPPVPSHSLPKIPLQDRGPAPAGMVDVRPRVPRNSTNVISKAEEFRDRVYEYLVGAFHKEGVEAQVLKSPPFSPAVWVQCECWIPHPHSHELTIRTSAKITVHAKEFHRFEQELSIEVQTKGRPRVFFSVVRFDSDDAQALVRCLLGHYPPRSLCFQRCRIVPFQFWRPKNKLVRLRRDPWFIVAWVLFGVGIATLSIVVGVVLIPVAIGLLIWRYCQKNYVISSGKPLQEPRDLLRMDSWQVLLNGLAAKQENIKSELHAELAKAERAGFNVGDENIWYLGIDGKEERAQVVVMFRRGISFVHVYPYGNDLYVGWDAHLNCGTWVEKPTLLAGVDRKTDARCRWHVLEADWHVPNEYDITDTNCLIEWVHSAVIKIVKKALADHQIDQEIDFRILRSERDGITGKEKPKDKDKAGTITGRIRSAFTAGRFRREG